MADRAAKCKRLAAMDQVVDMGLLIKYERYWNGIKVQGSEFPVVCHASDGLYPGIPDP
jgi:hypothetical protein